MADAELIINILNQANINIDTHDKGINTLLKILAKRNFYDYTELFHLCVYSFLQLNYQVENDYIDRFLTFLSRFCEAAQEEYTTSIESETDAPFVKCILLFLTQMAYSGSLSIRIRSCQFLANICFTVQAQNFTSGLREIAQNVLVGALEDLYPHVRGQAVLALLTFQDGGRWNSCSVAEAISELIRNDLSPDVRRAAVEYVALKRDLQNVICKASLDVNSAVRLALYQRALKFPLALQAVQRQYILFNVNYARCSIVRKYVEQELYPAWLKSYKFDYMRFLRLLRIDSSWEGVNKTLAVQENALIALFKVRPVSEIINVISLNDSRLLDIEDVDWDHCIYWRVLISHFLKYNMLEDYIKVSPSMPDLQSFIDRYCDFISKRDDYYTNKYNYQFVLTELFRIIEVKLENEKPQFQRSINKLIKQVFIKCDLEFGAIKEIIKVLNKSIPDDEKRIIFICGHANAILKRFTGKKASSRIECTVQSQTAQWLNVVAALLYNVEIKYITPELNAFKTDVLDGWLCHADVNIRSAAMRCFGYYCLLRKDIARKAIPMFCRILIQHNEGALVESTELLCVCTALVVDVIMTFGPTFFFTYYTTHWSRKLKAETRRCVVPEITLPQVVQILHQLVNDDNILVQQEAVRGVCTILMEQRIVSHKLIILLIQKYYLMNTKVMDIDHIVLQQYIELTFLRISHMPNVEPQFIKAALKFTKTVYEAESGTLARNVDIIKVVRYLTSIFNNYKLFDKTFLYLGVEIEKAVTDKPLVEHSPLFVEVAQLMQSTPPKKDRLIGLMQQLNDNKYLIDEPVFLKYLKICNLYFNCVLFRFEENEA